jgi:hypothetical protein
MGATTGAVPDGVEWVAGGRRRDRLLDPLPWRARSVVGVTDSAGTEAGPLVLMDGRHAAGRAGWPVLRAGGTTPDQRVRGRCRRWRA